MGSGSGHKRHTQKEGNGKWRLLVNTSALVNEEESKPDSLQKRRSEVSEAAEATASAADRPLGNVCWRPLRK